MAVRYRVHPAIGIARVGDSPDQFFIGPEAPGIASALTKPGDPSAHPGQYKDTQRRIKRQGARFRVYAYTEDAAGAVTKVQEVTAADAQIEWEVHLANRKAAASTLDGARRRNAAAPKPKTPSAVPAISTMVRVIARPAGRAAAPPRRGTTGPAVPHRVPSSADDR